jgi:hypothetical protein
VVWEELLAALGIAPSAEQLAALRARARFHAKAGARVFDGDPAPMREAAPQLPRLTQLLDMLAPLYAQLEARRLAGG